MICVQIDRSTGLNKREESEKCIDMFVALSSLSFYQFHLDPVVLPSKKLRFRASPIDESFDFEMKNDVDQPNCFQL